MKRTATPVITAAVEGFVDEAVVRRLVLDECRGKLGNVHGKNGKDDLRRKITAYNKAARRSHWIVLVDLDNEADCAPPMIAQWVPTPSPGMFFRVAVKAVESWLLSDRDAISKFLSVPVNRVPGNTDAIESPKRAIVDLARQSRRKNIREDMVPRPGSGRTVGPAYPSRMVEYVNAAWRPDVAARSSDSLRRCLVRLQELIRR